MFRLRLFGGLTLEDDSGVHTGKASQRRRLAVLALLATAPRRTLTRDKLLGLLWSDEDADQARHRLSVLLHELRKALGEDAIRSVGDDVTLDHEAVGSDVADFTAAISSGEYSRAVDLYDGPFLDGVYLSGAPEFERWIDSERDRWDRAYKQALERLAESQEARGEWRGAVETWRKLTTADRYNTRVALRCMTALARAGDSSGAIQFARVHELLVKEEMGVAPGAELQRLVDQIERGEVAAVAPTPAPTVPVAQLVATPVVAPQESAVVPAAQALRPREKPARTHLRFRRSQRSTAFLSGAFVVIAFIAIVAIDWPPPPPPPSESVVLGMLPLANTSDNDANEYFSDGLTEEILYALSVVDGLRVPSRTSVFANKGRQVTLRQAASEFGASHIIDGSVRRAGADLRVTVSLYDGKSELQVWTETYDRDMNDIFRVQKEIAQDVMKALRTRLGLQLKVRERKYTTRDPEAYDLYLRARAAWYSRAPNRLQLALRYFNEAIERDSTYALAYSGIADVYNMFGAYNYGLAPPGKAYPSARAAAEKALELDPQLPEAHAALGNYLYNYEWKWEEAEEELRTALLVNPGYSMARHWLELVLLISGKKEEALNVIRNAREQDPRSPLISSALAHHYYYRREFGKAIQEYKHSIELDSTFIVARLGLGMSYTAAGDHVRAIEQLRIADKLVGPHSPVAVSVLGYALGTAGQVEEARQILAKLQAEAKSKYIAPHFFALLHIGLRDYESTLSALEAAYAERSGVLLYIPFEPPLDPLRNNPRFKALVEKVHGR